MPRREAFEADSGDDGIGPPDRFAFSHTNLHNTAFFENRTGGMQEEDLELVELERRLNEEVDEDLFEEPRNFNTLQRVIDVLGLQMIDDATFQSEGMADLDKNPAYRQLKGQQKIVEGAIEHMAVIHCADLNGSVIQVGRVAKQFSEAVHKVRTLRRQVRDIQDTLGAGANPNEATAAAVAKDGVASGAIPQAVTGGQRPQNAAAMSLRELWLKKLECEATLALLDKLDVIRAAPARFDLYIRPQPQCRIGAAVLTLTEALQTMFSDDVAQVQALHKIMEQLMLRKQKAEEIVWDTLHDVIYLRTGNGLLLKRVATNGAGGKDDVGIGAGMGTRGSIKASSSGQSVSSESRRSSTRVSFRHQHGGSGPRRASASSSPFGMTNPFVGPQNHRYFAIDEDFDEDDDVGSDDDSTGSGASLFSVVEDAQINTPVNTSDSASVSVASGAPPIAPSQSSSSSIGGLVDTDILIKAAPRSAPRKFMIPIPIVQAELDLEADERRCLEEVALSVMATKRRSGGKSSLRQHQLPRYADPILALRILVECLAQLKRLDDVERVLGEGLEREIRKIVQREQARTFSVLEKRKHSSGHRQTGRDALETENGLSEFRRHLTGILSAFGCVMIRLSHLAEILRLRIGSDKELSKSIENPTSIMRPVLSSAFEIMQREIKNFLEACLRTIDAQKVDPMDSASNKGHSAYETGLFSLGIVEENGKSANQTMSTATRSNVMEMSTSKFVANVLFHKTHCEPQIRHALCFRRSIARWTEENENLKKELATLTGEDMSTASYKSAPEESAIAFLDGVIQKELLPVLQEEAVNGTIGGLEHRDAFDPVLDRALFTRPDSNEPEDVDMCTACQAMFDSTGPLFVALHRLPPGGEMYSPLVAVLEHVMLTFISRVKQQVEKICRKKTAYLLLEDEGKGSLSKTFERRRPYSMLLQAYSQGESSDGTRVQDELSKPSSLMRLSPPSSDTAPRQSLDEEVPDDPEEDLVEGVEGEEITLELELKVLTKYLTGADQSAPISICSDEELMKASCLAHSLLKLASLLDDRLKVRGTASNGFERTLVSTRTLQEAIKTIKRSGLKMAKFCRLDMMMQTVTRLTKVSQSSTLVARDAVRIPSSVNDLGEYLTSASDNLREASGNAVTAYTFSSLEQYIPYCLMQVVRVVAAGKGIITRSPLTMNGVEALDRSGSVLYRDLKGATSFDNSFWDVELAAVSFERSASFIAMMELEMEELIAYYSANQDDFSEEDFMLMFAMTGPRRRGDIGQYHMLKRGQK